MVMVDGDVAASLMVSLLLGPRAIAAIPAPVSAEPMWSPLFMPPA